jgi:hypothetical protein
LAVFGQERARRKGNIRLNSACDDHHADPHTNFEKEKKMLRTALCIVLKRDGWLIPFLVVLMAIIDYWRERQISIPGLFAGTFVAITVLLLAKIPVELRKLRNK